MTTRPAPTVERRAPHPERPRHATAQSRGRRALRTALWTVIVVCGLAYATSLAVPLWFQAKPTKKKEKN